MRMDVEVFGLKTGLLGRREDDLEPEGYENS